MVDCAALRKKFPPKNPDKTKRAAKIRAIAREYEMKKAELMASSPPTLKKGIVFYTTVVIGLMLLGSLVLSVTGRGGKGRRSKANMQAEKSVAALAVALGRYRYHTGSYPSTADGLKALADIRVGLKGWNGPYVKKIVKDPWGADYEYFYDGGDVPVLYSRGPDGLSGTGDDILPRQELFDEPFRDLSWLREWMPYTHRGYVVARNEEMKRQIEESVNEHKSDYAQVLSAAPVAPAAPEAAFAASGFSPEDLESGADAQAGRPDAVVAVSRKKSLADGECAVLLVSVVDRRGAAIAGVDWSRLGLKVEGPARIVPLHGLFKEKIEGGAVVKYPFAVQRIGGSGRDVKATASYPGAGSAVTVFPRTAQSIPPSPQAAPSSVI